MQRDILLVSEMLDAAEQVQGLVAGLSAADVGSGRMRRDSLLKEHDGPLLVVATGPCIGEGLDCPGSRHPVPGCADRVQGAARTAILAQRSRMSTAASGTPALNTVIYRRPRQVAGETRPDASGYKSESKSELANKPIVHRVVRFRGLPRRPHVFLDLTVVRPGSLNYAMAVMSPSSK